MIFLESGHDLLACTGVSEFRIQVLADVGVELRDKIMLFLELLQHPLPLCHLVLGRVAVWVQVGSVFRNN